MFIGRVTEDSNEIAGTALKSLYALCTMEDISGLIKESKGMDKLVQCLKARDIEISRLAGKIIHLIYLGEVCCSVIVG
jgi:hypothetical protein